MDYVSTPCKNYVWLIISYIHMPCYMVQKLPNSSVGFLHGEHLRALQKI